MSTYFEKITTPWPYGGEEGVVNPYGQPDRKKTVFFLTTALSIKGWRQHHRIMGKGSPSVLLLIIYSSPWSRGHGAMVSRKQFSRGIYVFTHLHWKLVNQIRQGSPRFKGDPRVGWDELEPYRSYLSHFPTWYSKSGLFPIEIPIKNEKWPLTHSYGSIILKIVL